MTVTDILRELDPAIVALIAAAIGLIAVLARASLRDSRNARKEAGRRELDRLRDL